MQDVVVGHGDVYSSFKKKKKTTKVPMSGELIRRVNESMTKKRRILDIASRQLAIKVAII